MDVNRLRMIRELLEVQLDDLMDATEDEVNGQHERDEAEIKGAVDALGWVVQCFERGAFDDGVLGYWGTRGS